MLLSFANTQGGSIKSANPRRCSRWTFGNHSQRNVCDTELRVFQRIYLRWPMKVSSQKWHVLSFKKAVIFLADCK